PGDDASLVMLAPLRAFKLATELDLDVDLLPICHMCLFDVAVTVDTGDERKINGAVTRLTPHLWAEGLEAPARAALEDARRRGVREAPDKPPPGRARRNGRSPNSEGLENLHAAAERDRAHATNTAELAENAKRINLPPDVPKPEDVIREAREERARKISGL